MVENISATELQTIALCETYCSEINWDYGRRLTNIGTFRRELVNMQKIYSSRKYRQIKTLRKAILSQNVHSFFCLSDDYPENIPAIANSGHKFRMLCGQHDSTPIA